MNGSFNCSCIEKLNRLLEPQFLYVETGMMFNLKTGKEWTVMTIPLGKYDVPKGKKRPRPPRIIMAYCPMCGTKTNGLDEPAAIDPAVKKLIDR